MGYFWIGLGGSSCLEMFTTFYFSFSYTWRAADNLLFWFYTFIRSKNWSLVFLAYKTLTLASFYLDLDCCCCCWGTFITACFEGSWIGLTLFLEGVWTTFSIDFYFFWAGLLLLFCFSLSVWLFLLYYFFTKGGAKGSMLKASNFFFLGVRGILSFLAISATSKNYLKITRHSEKISCTRSSFIIEWKTWLNNPAQVGRIGRRNGRILPHNDLQSQGSLIIGLERMFSSAEFVDNATHCPDIRFLIIWFLFTHLRWR